MLPADGIVEIKEDFLGNGEFSSFTNHDLAKDRAMCKGDLAYGRSLSFSGSNCSMFSGFEFDGLGSYQVASPEHLLRLFELTNLSAQAAINYRSGSQEEKEGLQQSPRNRAIPYSRLRAGAKSGSWCSLQDPKAGRWTSPAPTTPEFSRSTARRGSRFEFSQKSCTAFLKHKNLEV